MNIMILSSGSNCKLVEYFKRIENGWDRVMTTDCSPYAPTAYRSDAHFVVPPFASPDYLPLILELCKREKADAVLPLREDELEIIADARESFADIGVAALVASLDTVRLCRDKSALYKTLASNGIPCVYTVDASLDDMTQSSAIGLPAFLKPRYGCASVGISKMISADQMREYIKASPEPLVVQPYISAEEFGVDLYVDMVSKEIISIFAKRKLRMRSGETDKAISIKDDELTDLVARTAHILNLRGPNDMDIFKIDGKYHILEVNPRFGGGYPLAYECGISFPAMLCANAAGLANRPTSPTREGNFVFLRFSDIMILRESDLYDGR